MANHQLPSDDRGGIRTHAPGEKPNPLQPTRQQLPQRIQQPLQQIAPLTQPIHQIVQQPIQPPAQPMLIPQEQMKPLQQPQMIQPEMMEMDRWPMQAQMQFPAPMNSPFFQPPNYQLNQPYEQFPQRYGEVVEVDQKEFEKEQIVAK